MANPTAELPTAATTPKTRAPEGSWDCHFHMVGGADDFQLWDGRVEDPAPGPDFEEWLKLYREQSETLGFSKGVIVHTILYGTNNAITLETMRTLGPGYKGVGLLPDGAPNDAVVAFRDAGMKAVRLNYVHGGVLTWDGAKEMAPLLADNGMHLQMLCHADKHMDEIAADVRALPVPVVFDHCAWPTAGLAADGVGIETLCGLLADGVAYVKLTALYRLCAAPYGDADALVRRLIDANPERCLWGTDWPYLMLNGAQSPQPAQSLDALMRVANAAEVQQILVDTPEALFGA
ncbi:MAG: amidohydrolase family protein [Rhodobacteraceae bacterium]|nr:amidohydrolase family protein [Paracoccaceae bacterium]